MSTGNLLLARVSSLFRFARVVRYRALGRPKLAETPSFPLLAYLFFFPLLIRSKPKLRYIILFTTRLRLRRFDRARLTVEWSKLSARSMVVPGGRSPPLRPMLIGAVKPGAGPPPIPVRFRVGVGLGT